VPPMHRPGRRRGNQHSRRGKHNRRIAAVAAVAPTMEQSTAAVAAWPPRASITAVAAAAAGKH